MEKFKKSKEIPHYIFIFFIFYYYMLIYLNLYFPQSPEMAESSGKGANGESGADVGSLSADISEDLAAMETEAEGECGQKGGESALPSAMGGQMTPASVGTRSPRLSATAGGGATMVEEDERS